MERIISMYSEITGGMKRTNVDLLVDGQVKDRQVSEGYSHSAVDEYAMRQALDFAGAYLMSQGEIKDLGLMPYQQFCAEAAR